MNTISGTLREEASVPEKGWPLLAQAADTIDELVAALERCAEARMPGEARSIARVALAKVRQ